MQPISYARHQFPPVVIRQAVWLLLRFPLSDRDVEELLAERGLDVTYETVRRRVLSPKVDANGDYFGLPFVYNLQFRGPAKPSTLPAMVIAGSESIPARRPIIRSDPEPVCLGRYPSTSCGSLPFQPGLALPISGGRHPDSVEPEAMANRKDRQPPATHPNSRKPDLRSLEKTPSARGNTRIVDQNRKLMGKHYANKYRTGR